MMNKPLISVIVPVYRVEEYLDRCIESIVNQTYGNLEIILVDDDSPDKCPEMCDAWAERDSRIRVLHIENKGVANARNKGLEVATGEYIGFADSDDWLELNLFETLLKSILDNNADVSVCGYGFNDFTNDTPDDVRIYDRDYAMRLICVGDYKYGMLWNKLYKRELLEGIKLPLFECCEDLTFNYFVFKRVNRIAETDSALYHYFQNNQSIVHSSFKEGAFDAVKSKEIMLENERGTELEPYAIRGLVSSCFVVLSGVISSGKLTDRYDYLKGYIMKYKFKILFSDLYSVKDKVKTIILAISSRLYNRLIKLL